MAARSAQSFGQLQAEGRMVATAAQASPQGLETLGQQAELAGWGANPLGDLFLHGQHHPMGGVLGFQQLAQQGVFVQLRR